MRPRVLFIVAASILIVLLTSVGWVFRHRLASLPVLGRRTHGDSGQPALTPSGTPTSAASSATSSSGTTPRGDVTIDPRRQQLLGVRTVAAERSSMNSEIRTIGTVQYDETRLVDVNLKIEGWIRDLRVNYTGQSVAKGQVLFTIYSPDLLTSVNEYLLALKTRDQMQPSQIAEARARADQLVASARRRLALWDLPEEDLRAIEETRQAKDVIAVRSPASGVVIEKSALEGQHIMPGQNLYKVADLSVVWVEAEVYEQELRLVHIGDRATVTLDAYPGEDFSGRVLYIYPYVSQQTRTNKVRYEFANPRGRLKPGMYANVVLTAPGGMAVVVPANAVLDSGKEQLVFVAQGDGYFQPRHVTVGRRLGDKVQVVAGLKEGEQVATGATFFLDSESQLRASLQAYESPSAPAAGVGTREQLTITLRTVPDPPKTGEAQFEATVKDSKGAPVEGADVAVQLFMAAMPTMNMPAMRNEVKLSAAGGGAYRGTGQLMMAGRWDATVIVSKAGQRLGSTQTTLVAR